MTREVRGRGAWIVGPYRYELRRWWDDRPLVCWVGLNPSTADAVTDDATVRLWMGHADRLGFGGMIVVNLYAWRATRPSDLPAGPERVGPRNDEAWSHAFAQSSRVFACWGARAESVQARRATFAAHRLGHDVWALAFTKDGAPRHPRGVRMDAEPVVWSRR